MRQLIIFFVIILLTGCDGSSSEERDNDGYGDSPIISKESAIVSPAINEVLAVGKSITVEVTSTQPIDSIAIIYGGERTAYPGNQVIWEIPTANTGQFRFQVEVIQANKKEVHYPRVILHSDIIPEQKGYLVTGVYDHDPQAYTQGLVYANELFYESTGIKGESSMRKVEALTGKVLKLHPLNDELFGEGCALYQGQVYQLTWRARQGYVYDTDINEQRSFTYPTEGWGLTTWGDSLVMSDGSSTIYFMNPSDFAELGRIEVYNHEGPVENLNELEFINGKLYANEYLTDNIHIIEASTGRVLTTVDMSGLLTQEEAEQADVLNGIAYDEEGDRLFVTGKLWPYIYEIKLQPKTETL